ncbi:MAG TPA: HWE histidine kinase domain-containing protein [Caulobacteraceae bacterium]|nr:HWE histidine kinase domain-containing protein [Caulobacteraceae bacterium]
MATDPSLRESSAALPNAAETDGEFRRVFEASPRPLLLIRADPPRYTMLAVNGAHARAFNTTPDALVGHGVLEVFGQNPAPEVAAFVAAIRASFEAVLGLRQPHRMEVRSHAIAGADGRLDERYWTATNVPIFRADEGPVARILSAVEDVTGEVLERRSEELRELMARENEHRTRNTLMLVQSLVRLTTGSSVETFREVLDGRIAALARAQTSLATRRWVGASVGEVIETELSLLIESHRYSLAGPTVILTPEKALALGMITHELATNAAKYGSLSTRGGELAIDWDAANAELQLRWVETGDRAIAAPKRPGFGTKLIGQLVEQHGGSASFEWPPSGLVSTVRIRLG